jgi:hypothetical protein
MRNFLRAVFGLCLFVPLASFGTTFTIVSDSTFNPANWSQSLTGTTVPGATAGFSQVISGGNPGPYGRVDFQTPAAGAFALATLYTAQTYTPATQGAISSFTISADFEDLAGGAPVFLVFKQGDTYFSPETYVDVYNLSWFHASVTGTPGSGSLAGANLINGPAIQFGVFVEYSTSDFQYPDAFGIDNFSVTITPVPEPGVATISFAGVGLFAFLFRNGRLKLRQR